MGNLYQESKFSTDGDGIAQWLGNRLTALKQRGEWTDLTTQLDYIIWELNNTESSANTHFMAQSTLEGATIAFQTYYERCNPQYCMQNQRILYATDINNRN